MQDGLTQPPHGFHASKADADRKGFSFCALETQERVRARVLLLTEVFGPKTNFLLRLRRSILGSENLSHRMNDARVKSCLNPGRPCRLVVRSPHSHG